MLEVKTIIIVEKVFVNLGINSKMNLRQETLHNINYRKVIRTFPDFQLVLMSLEPKEEIGMEVHPTTLQFFYIEEGIGQAIIGNEHFALGPGSSVIVPPGHRHNVINESKTKRLKLFTIYVPPEHEAYETERYK